MSQEIKFRGYSETYQKWYYGYFAKSIEGEPFIIVIDDFGIYDVIEKTVGQFAWLHDKNKKEVYNGDLLRYPPTNDWEKTNFSCFEVFFHDGDSNADYNIGYRFRMHNHGAVCGGYIPSFKPTKVSQMVIIGNIHDNPELLEKR